MGDWLRRLLYPLVLPAIVGTVWACGWVRQQDDRAARGNWTFSPRTIPSRAPFNPQANLPDGPAAPARTEFFATASADDADEAVDEP